MGVNDKGGSDWADEWKKVNEWYKARGIQWGRELLSEQINEQTSEWSTEWGSQWGREAVSGPMNESVN